MTEDHDQERRKSSAEAWREVGQRFEALGHSVAAAFKEAWQDEASQEALHEVEVGLQSAARAVADTVDEAAASPEGKQLLEEAERFAQSAQEAGKEALDEARPQLLAALQSVRAGLQSAIDALQQTRSGAPTQERDPESPEE